MTPITYIRTYLHRAVALVKDWARDEPVRAKYLSAFVLGAAAAVLHLDPLVILALLSLGGYAAQRSLRAKVTPEHRAVARVAKAVAAERERNTVSKPGITVNITGKVPSEAAVKRAIDAAMKAAGHTSSSTTAKGRVR